MKLLNLRNSFQLLVVSLILMLVYKHAYAFSPPQQVIESFKKRFSTVNQVKWVKANELSSEFTVKFKMGGDKCTATFRRNGEFVSFNKPFKKKDLPEKVIYTLINQYPDCKVKSCILIENSYGEVSYGLHISNHGENLEIAISSDGNITVW